MNETPSGSQNLIGPAVAPATRRVSWGAIWAGMFVTLVLEIMFLVLGVACGIQTLNPFANPQTTPAGLSIGADIWLMVSWLVAVWIGACIAGWMCGGPRRADGSVHGLVVWSFASAVILLLMTGVAGTVLGSVGGVFKGTSNPGVAGLGPSALSQPQNALAPTGRTGNETSPAQNESPQSQDQQGASNQHQSQAGQEVWSGALWTFIALILGLGCAAWGGAAGVPVIERPRTLAPA